MTANVWAGYVDITASGGSWAWGEESNITLESIGWCSGELDSTRYTHAALVKRENGTWCLGRPNDALVSASGATPDYESKYGHFLCERVEPDPLSYVEGVTE